MFLSVLLSIAEPGVIFEALSTFLVLHSSGASPSAATSYSNDMIHHQMWANFDELSFGGRTASLFLAGLLYLELFNGFGLDNQSCLVVWVSIKFFPEIVYILDDSDLRQEALLRSLRLPPLPLLFLRALGIKVEILVVKGAIRLTIIVILDKFVTASQGTR